jgi:hypothetical protein
VGHYVRFDRRMVQQWVEDRRRPAVRTPARAGFPSLP